MNKIEIKGEASASIEDNLESLSGIDCQECFSDFFQEGFLKDKKVTGGYLTFEYENGKLYSVTTYDSDELLTDSELDQLAKYTQGQWSDGIGEGFEQEPATYIDDEEVFISPWFYGQTLEVRQYQD